MRSSFPLFAAIAVLLAPTLAHADTRHPISLAAGPLGDAIVALSRATGASIRLTDVTLWQRPVPAVAGRISVREALDRLLAGSGARPVRIGDRSWQIDAAPPPPARDHTPAIEAPPENPIIVSASKRGTRLADFPGTVSILTGASLGNGGPADSDTLGDRAASVTSTHLGAGRDKLFIRGVADSGLVGQSQATVGQYLGDIRLTYNAPDPDLKLYDIAAIEVLEGPQGTLYGAGSPGGIVRIVRNEPAMNRVEGAATAGFSTIAHGSVGGDGSAMLNLPLVPGSVALRMVGYASSEGGYIDNATTGRSNINRVHTEGGRAMLRIEPGNDWTIGIGGTVQDIHGDDSQYADSDGPPLTRRNADPQPYDDNYRMGELSIAKDWGALRFTSSNAIVRQSLAERYDATLAPIQLRVLQQWNRTTMISTENRLSKPMSDGIGWVVGTSFLHNSARLSRLFDVGNGERAPTAGVENRISEETTFGEFSVEPLRGLTLTAGGRLTHSRLSGEGTGPAVTVLTPVAGVLLDKLPLEARIDDEARPQNARSETKFLPSFSASAEPGPGLILFARYQQSFRPGGLATGNEMLRRFKSDRVATMEAGIRYDRPGDDAISIAASVAHTDWRNIQADFLDAAGLPVTTNIGDGRIWSFDMQAAWRPVPELRLEASFVVNDSKLTRPDVAQINLFRTLAASVTTPAAAAAEVQQELPNVAELGGRLGIDYHHTLGHGLDLSASGWGRYIGKSRLGVGPLLGGKEGNYVDTGLSVRIGRGNAGVTLSASNLLDTVGNRFALGTPLNVVRSTEITPLQPRMIRLGFDTHF